MYAMTKNSRRARGQAVACDLVRVACRGANMLSAMRHNEAMRARLSEDFGGYLVTDDEAGYPFKSKREIYRSRLEFDSTAATGSWAWSPHIRFSDEAGGALDAPKWIAAGFMSAKCSEYVGAAVMRAGA